MNRRQRSKIVPSSWLIVSTREGDSRTITLYAIDFLRGVRMSWGDWASFDEWMRARIPLKSKSGGSGVRHISAAKITSKAIRLDMDARQKEQLERRFNRALGRKAWKHIAKEGKDPLCK